MCLDKSHDNFAQLFALSSAQASELDKTEGALRQALLDIEGLHNRLMQAADEIVALRRAIREHHDKSVGHSLCWENDVELWATIGIQALHEDLKVPPWCEFMQQCAEYRASREKEKA